MGETCNGVATRQLAELFWKRLLRSSVRGMKCGEWVRCRLRGRLSSVLSGHTEKPAIAFLTAIRLDENPGENRLDGAPGLGSANMMALTTGTKAKHGLIAFRWKRKREGEQKAVPARPSDHSKNLVLLVSPRA